MKILRGVAVWITVLILLCGADSAWAAFLRLQPYSEATGIGQIKPASGATGGAELGGKFTTNVYHMEGVKDSEIGIYLEINDLFRLMNVGGHVLEQLLELAADDEREEEWEEFISGFRFEWYEGDYDVTVDSSDVSVGADDGEDVLFRTAHGRLGINLSLSRTNPHSYSLRVNHTDPAWHAVFHSTTSLPYELAKLDLTTHSFAFRLIPDSNPVFFMKDSLIDPLNPLSYTKSWKLENHPVSLSTPPISQIEVADTPSIKNGYGQSLENGDDVWKGDTTGASNIKAHMTPTAHSITLEQVATPTLTKGWQRITIAPRDIRVVDTFSEINNTREVTVISGNIAPVVSFDVMISEYSLTLAPDRLVLPVGEALPEPTGLTVKNDDFGVQNLRLFDGETRIDANAAYTWNGLSFTVVAEDNQIQIHGTPIAQETKTFRVEAEPTNTNFPDALAKASFDVAVGNEVIALTLDPANVTVPAQPNFSRSVTVSADYPVNDITLSHGNQTGTELTGVSGLTVKVDSTKATEQITISGTPDNSAIANSIPIKVSAKSLYGVVTDATLTITIDASEYTLTFTPENLRLLRGQPYSGGITATLKDTATDAPKEISRLAISGQTGEMVAWHGLTLQISQPNQIMVSGEPNVAGRQSFTIQAWAKNSAGVEEETATGTLILVIQEPGVAGDPGSFIVIDNVRVGGRLNGTVPLGSGTTVLLQVADGTPGDTRFTITLVSPSGLAIREYPPFTPSGGQILVMVDKNDLKEVGTYHLEVSYLQNQLQSYQRIPFEVTGDSGYDGDISGGGCSTMGWGIAALGLCAAILRKKS